MNIKKIKIVDSLIIISYTKLYVILLYYNYNVIKYKNILYRQINLNKK